MTTQRAPRAPMGGSIALLLIVMAVAGEVLAQTGGAATRDRIRVQIENEPRLQDQERERLRQHLEECQRLGLDDETVGVLFAESSPLRDQIQTQERVLAMAREGLPHELVTQKLREGQRKGASDEVLRQVCTRMEGSVRAAQRVMARARRDGLAQGDASVERQRTCEMAMAMWRGLNEGEGDLLRERARFRLREGSCTTEDLTASADTAAKLGEMGIERGRALRMAGEALQCGYTAREMRQFSWMVMTAHAHGGPHDEVLDALERGIRSHQGFAEMTQEMWQRGWMGPADEHGGQHGETNMNDMTGNGPGGHHDEQPGGHHDDQPGGHHDDQPGGSDGQSGTGGQQHGAQGGSGGGR